MYRQGLGDCLLLSFGPENDAKHMLVDCGVILGTPNATAVMSTVVEHIAESTGNRIDYVVATHEHWDHLSGFVQAREQFTDIEFGETWFGWTEAPDDEQAIRLRADRNDRKAHLKLALDDMHAVGMNAAAQLTGSLLEFFGDAAVGAAGGRSTADAMNYLLERESKRRFLEPGTSFALPGVEGVRVFVLGPPRDESMIRKSRPSTRTPETYSEPSAALSVQVCFFDGLCATRTTAEHERNDLIFPFDVGCRIPVKEAQSRSDEYFHQRYGFGEDDIGTAPKWRRIDGDWLGMAEELAIALDNDTNNTSLVLAIEIEPDGDVILLPADAQVGNWLSWQDMTFRVRTGSKTRIVKTADLLARTVLYKVGHHASHNATLRELGLERMTNERLIAMVPVDQEMAEKKQWNMPFPPLFERLREKCSGRVLRIDTGLPDGRTLRRLSTDEREAFQEIATADELYLDIVLG
jgi:hypothetical protein